MTAVAAPFWQIKSNLPSAQNRGVIRVVRDFPKVPLPWRRSLVWVKDRRSRSAGGAASIPVLNQTLRVLRPPWGLIVLRTLRGLGKSVMSGPLWS
jgi:hypothetical protein